VSLINIDTDTVAPPPPQKVYSVEYMIPTMGLVTTESGGTASFGVKLTAAPQANTSVTISFASRTPTEGKVNTGNILSFDAANWSIS